MFYKYHVQHNLKGKILTLILIPKFFIYRMPPPNDMQAKLLRQLILAGMVDQVARKFSSTEMNQGEGRRKLKYAYK